MMRTALTVQSVVKTWQVQNFWGTYVIAGNGNWKRNMKIEIGNRNENAPIAGARYCACAR